MLLEAWSLLSVEVQGVFLDAESKLGTLNTITLGPPRAFTVGDSALWSRLCGASFAAQVAAVVSLQVAPASLCKAAALAKEVAAIRYGHMTGPSITKFLKSPVAGKRPKLIRKGTKAAAAEEAAAAAEAEAAADLEKIKRLAAGFHAAALKNPWAAAIAGVQEPGDTLREGWLASLLLGETERHSEALAKAFFKREAAEAEAAEVAAAEAAAVAAAKAAAAALAAAAAAAAAAVGSSGALGRGRTGAMGGLELVDRAAVRCSSRSGS
jgi:hypothetical protein